MIPPETIMLAVSLIRRDGGTQIRAQVSMDVAKDYAEALERGDTFPPVKARFDGTHYWLCDGFHRIMAAEMRGAAKMAVEVKPGTRRDAILDAVGANAAHGFRRTNADKRQAVLVLLDDAEWSAKSDREIARIAHVDPGMVGCLRPPPSVDKPQMRTVVRGGAEFKMRVAGINEGRNAPGGEVSGEIGRLAPLPPGRGSRQLREFLGELRAGTDVETAAIVADISIAEAQDHATAEANGEYADIEAIPPLAVISGGNLVISAPGLAANDIVIPLVDPEPAPPVVDFETAQVRDTVMRAISTLADAPAPVEMAALWAAHLGRPTPSAVVDRAAAWLTHFNTLFPDADASRERTVAIMMEKL
ncbi:hypothetical protein ACKU27_13665 [Sphingobium yanoikuyae]|uniref:hypothetical protein n=1 Tax=Sphingobium yanoikuyae TaxID=13690 RepID=UPI003B91D1A9